MEVEAGESTQIRPQLYTKCEARMVAAGGGGRKVGRGWVTSLEAGWVPIPDTET